MSHIFGVYYRYQTVSPLLMPSVTHSVNYWNADKLGYWSDKHIGLGSLLLINTPEAINEQQPFHCQHLVTVADMRLDNRDELCKLLKLNTSTTDCEILTLSYLKWHERCTDYLLGDFAFAIWNTKTNTLFCARDHMGVKPLYYVNNEHLFAFGSELNSLLKMPSIKSIFDDLEIARFLTIDVLMSGEYTENTLYKNIKRLTPAHQIHVDHQGMNKRQYWDLHRKELKYKHELDYVEQYKALFNESVKSRLRSSRAVCCELSGGIDSSSVTAYATKHNHDIIAITHSAPKDTVYLDESKVAKSLCDFCNISKHIIINADDYDLITASQHAIKTSSMPLQVTQPVLAHGVMKAAQRLNTGVILSGFGGDECVTGHGSFLTEEFALQKQWLNLWRELKAKARLSKKLHFKSFMSVYLKHQYPQILRLIKKNVGKHTVSIQDLIINKAFAESTHLPKNFEEFRSLYHFNSIREAEYAMLVGRYSWHLRARIENSNLYAQGFKLEYRYPMLDIRLLEFCWNLPSELKRQQGWGRYIARKGLEGMVPKTLQWRQDKAGSPVPAALHRIKEGGQLLESLQKIPLSPAVTYYFGEFKPELLDHSDSLINLYALRSGMNALQFQLLQNEFEKITA